MRRLLERIGNFCGSEGGVTSVEYAILLALLLAVSLSVVPRLGATSFIVFHRTSVSLKHGS
jgi:Flp pilus assembly pilin Flp